MKSSESSKKDTIQIGEVALSLARASEDLRKKQEAFARAKEALAAAETKHEGLLVQFEQACGVIREESFVKRMAK